MLGQQGRVPLAVISSGCSPNISPYSTSNSMKSAMQDGVTPELTLQCMQSTLSARIAMSNPPAVERSGVSELQIQEIMQ